jgi:ABC-type branched-subunit amino acid transport system substrate-binding protein
LTRKFVTRSSVGGVALVVALLLLGAACGSSSSKSGSSTGSTTGSNTGATTGSAQGTASSGSNKGPIVIGLGIPLSGPNAISSGPSVTNVHDWANAINAKGGINGRQIQVVQADTGVTPADGVNAVEKLLNSHPVAIVGMGITDQIVAVAPIVQRAKVLLLTNSASAHTNYAATGNPWIYGFHTFTDTAGKDTLAFAQSLQPTPHTVALLVDDTEFGSEYSQAVTPLLSGAGLKVVASQQLDPLGTSAVTQVERIQSAHPDLILDQLYPQEATLFYEQAAKVGYKLPPIVATEGTGFGVILGVVPSALATGTYVDVDAPVFYSTSPPASFTSWEQADQVGSKFPVTATVGQQWDALNVLGTAITKAGSTDPGPLLSAMEQTSGVTGFDSQPMIAATAYTCDATHLCYHGQSIMKVQGKSLVLVQSYQQ